MVKVSVIVPVYNAAKYLEQCIESIVNQTLDEIEIILVNDCSPDNSYEIMEKWYGLYPDKIRLINSPENRRQGGARNMGLDIAQGEYITFVDNDDWIAPDAMEKMYEKTIGREADVVYTNKHYIVSEEGSVTGVRTLTDIPVHEGLVTAEIRKKFIIETFGVWSSLYNKNYIKKHNLRFPEKVHFDDAVFLAESVCCVSSVCFCDYIYYYYRRNPLSTTQDYRLPNLLSQLAAAEILTKNYLKRLDKKEYYEEIEWIFISRYYIGLKWQALRVKPYVYEMMSRRKLIRKEFPHFEKNKIFIKKHKKRVRYKLWDMFPRLYVFMRRFIGKKVN